MNAAAAAAVDPAALAAALDRAGAMWTPPADMDPLERALSYPYETPAHSYLFRNGAAAAALIGAADRDGRIPVLACGSNRAPAQLARKFAEFPDAAIPVERVTLQDFDAVYAAHISGYGAIAATLQHCPGCAVELFVTWLPEQVMDRMHASEGRGIFYDYVRLDGVALVDEGGAAVAPVYAYAFRGGCLNLDGAPAAVAAVPARNRRFRALDQRAVQDAVRVKLGDPRPLPDFVLAAIADRAERLAREARLCADALPFAWTRAAVIPAGHR